MLVFGQEFYALTDEMIFSKVILLDFSTISLGENRYGNVFMSLETFKLEETGLS